jgi:hypothetical protein
VLRAFEALQVIYASDTRSIDAERVDDEVLSLFDESDSLRDWLRDDLAVPPLSEEVKPSNLTSALAICNAICNTHKHRSRERGQPAARIEHNDRRPDGTSISFILDEGKPTQSTHDALVLATECMKEWRTLFAKHGLQEPPAA